MLLLAIIAAPPCFCLNGGSYDDETGCVCAGNFVGPFCGKASDKSCFRNKHVLMYEPTLSYSYTTIYTLADRYDFHIHSCCFYECGCSYHQ